MWWAGKKNHTQRRRSAVGRLATRVTDGRQTASEEQLHVYRRNRTISSHTNAEGMTHRAHHLQLRAVRRRIAAIATCFIIAAFAALYLAVQFAGTITVQVQSGGTLGVASRDERDKYVQLVNDYLVSRPIERFRFALSEDALRMYLQHEAPEIASLRVKGGAIGEAVVSLEWRQPVASWRLNDTQYFVDRYGVIFATSNTTTTAVEVIDNSGVRAEAGAQVVSHRLLSFVGIVVPLLEKQGWTIEHIEVPPSTTRQIIVKVSGKPAIRMTIDRAGEAQVADAVSAIAHLTSRSQQAEYIDVRTARRVFYR